MVVGKGILAVALLDIVDKILRDFDVVLSFFIDVSYFTAGVGILGIDDLIGCNLFLFPCGPG